MSEVQTVKSPAGGRPADVRANSPGPSGTGCVSFPSKPTERVGRFFETAMMPDLQAQRHSGRGPTGNLNA